MFNNIIYFIIVLLIFSISYSGEAPEGSLLFSFVMILVCWLIFAGFCRLEFRVLLERLDHGNADGSRLAGQYHRLVAKLSVLAIFSFSLAVYLFNFKYWLLLIPGVRQVSVLQGMFALLLFVSHLITIWYFSYPVHRSVFQSGVTRRSFVRSNLKLNLPILIPWFILSTAYDLIALSPWYQSGVFMSGFEGQILLFACLLSLLMVFMPGILQYLWGCKPIKRSEKGRQLEAFIRERRFKCRHLLEWPIFEGRIMTAGIMGIIPRFRYLLVTASLLKNLSIEELKAVLAHEMGHAKYRHLLFHIIFFVGFAVISFGLYDFSLALFSAHPLFLEIVTGENPHMISLSYLLLSLPTLIVLIVYFRYVMGFFMRNFERQADLYSALTMGTPAYTISALEKIALLSGKSRNLPSWHHFSIKERADCLWRMLGNPGLVKQHNRFVVVSFLIYLASLGALGYLLNFSLLKEDISSSLKVKALNRLILKEPENVNVRMALAMIYDQLEKHEEAIDVYKEIIGIVPNEAIALNNLAWLLVTAPDEQLRDEALALVLAEKAVALQRSPVFLDTLAEAYYSNGLIKEAVETIEEAFAHATENREYYEKQLRKFTGKAVPTIR